MGRYKPRFHCKSEAQKQAIRRSYAIRQEQQREDVLSLSAPFQLPLRNGGVRWNIYRVPNFILNGKQDGDVHGGLVLDELNDNVMLVQVTHSSKKGKRNNLPVRNLNSLDIDGDGKLRDAYLERRLIVSVEKKTGREGIDVGSLTSQINDLQFSEEEKRRILNELSHLSTAEERYKLFEKLAKEKADV